MGVLTYADPGCHAPAKFGRDIAVFWKRLRAVRGGKAFPYVWVPEWHKTGHGLHGHFTVGGFVRRSHLLEVWPHGFVYIKLVGDLPVGSGKSDEARAAAGYLSKYLGKEIGHERVLGRHRYDVAQDFQPQTLEVWGRTLGHAIDAACDVFGGPRPSWSWTSVESEDWACPPSVSLRWDD